MPCFDSSPLDKVLVFDPPGTKRMYVPKAFEQKDQQVLLDFIHQFPFATLIGSGSGQLEAAQFPLIAELHDGELRLKGHMARGNSLWKLWPQNSEVMVLFHGPNCYVSPNLYPSKQENGKAVPTWNYVTVQARGTIDFVHDSEFLTGLLNQLTSIHERDQEQPWSMDDAPHTYISQLIGAIVGFEIRVTDLQGKWKLSQNQPAVNRAGVIEGLANATHHDMQVISEWVAKAQPI